MTPGSIGYKVSENGQGAVRFEGIAEYTSRPCRRDLALSVYGELKYQVQIDKEKRRRNGEKVVRGDTGLYRMAKALGVTRRTIRRWRKGGFQSCDINANKLIKLAFHYVPEKCSELLEKDLNRHWQEYSDATAENGQGAVLSQPVGVIA